jgi:hypothetical protein
MASSDSAIREIIRLDERRMQGEQELFFCVLYIIRV